MRIQFGLIQRTLFIHWKVSVFSSYKFGLVIWALVHLFWEICFPINQPHVVLQNPQKDSAMQVSRAIVPSATPLGSLMVFMHCKAQPELACPGFWVLALDNLVQFQFDFGTQRHGVPLGLGWGSLGLLAQGVTTQMSHTLSNWSLLPFSFSYLLLSGWGIERAPIFL